MTRLVLAILLSGCVSTEYTWDMPDTDAVTERFIEQWESVEGESVSGDFRDALSWEFVEEFWGPCAEHPESDGCTYWDDGVWVFHLQIKVGWSPEATRGLMYHELTHAALRHHYGDIDPGHVREQWQTVTAPLEER